MKIAVVSTGLLPAPPKGLSEKKREHLKKLKKEWNNRNKEHVKKYTYEHRERQQYGRRALRQSIYREWGKTGRQDWRLAEKIACNIIQTNGFRNVVLHTDEFFTSPFDISGINMMDNQTYVFQVTMRTHTLKKKAHKLAVALNLVHKVIFISMQLNKFVVKDFSPSGIAELNMQEVLQAREFV